MPCAEINLFELDLVLFPTVGKDREAVAAPDLLFGGVFRLLKLRLKLRSVIPVEFAAECPIGHLARDPSPRERELHFLAQIPPGLLEAPHERSRIEPW